MDAVTRAQIAAQCRGFFAADQALTRYNSWRAGGSAEYLFLPEDVDDLRVFLSLCPLEVPVTWLGLGSNVLIRDGGIRGVVIVNQNRLSGLRQAVDDPLKIIVGSGVSCAQLARFAARHHVGGLAFLAGVPGTIGGALAMNAGANGGETWQFVSQVETISRQGELVARTPDEYDIGYRQAVANFPGQHWFISAEFYGLKQDSQLAKTEIKALLKRRTETQPTNHPSCGSVFRNPPGDFAARLIETAGLKGVCIGDACVSEKHANFIINQGAATATDIEALIATVAARVHQQHGIELIREVNILGQIQ